MCPPGGGKKGSRSPSGSPIKRAKKSKKDQKRDIEGEKPVTTTVDLDNFEGIIPEMERLGRFVGAHVSAAGGLYNAFLNSKKIGGNAMALFLKSQRQWAAKPLEDETILKFKDTCQQLGFDMTKVLPHGSYLVNLGNPDEEKRKKSYEAFLDELKRCDQLGIKLYNFHPGSTVGACSVKESIQHIADCINEAIKATCEVTVVIENMAGQGNVIGGKFEHLRDIIELVEDKSRIGVCLDTCHTFAAGYDLRSAKAYQKTMDEFEKVVGFKYLKAMHLNDSMTPHASGKDRHESIGKGHLGIAAFQNIMNDERLLGIPMVLETPLHPTLGESCYRDEIKLLYSLIERKE